ncbi:hypothetical protein DWB67_17185 [Paracoccus sp. JM45]|nr:hypothetical protein DWB67_17185 [Paracoccus sp. JM45]
MDLPLSNNTQKINSDIVVRALICHRDVQLGIHCLSSLIRYCTDPVKITLHDDGSLTTEDIILLEKNIPNVAIVSKIDADNFVRPLLSRYPQSLAFRDRSPTGQKMFDIPLMATGDIVLCDTDILFFRPFSGAFTWPDSSADMLFLQDTTDSYSLKPWNTNPHRLRHRYNAGLMMMRKNQYDLRQIETLIEFIENSSDYKQNEPHQWFLEQTCWSALAGTRDARIWDGKQMRVIRNNDSYSPELVAGHFVGGIRPLLQVFEIASKNSKAEKLPAVQIRSKAAADYTSFNYIQRRVLNKIIKMVGC